MSQKDWIKLRLSDRQEDEVVTLTCNIPGWKVELEYSLLPNEIDEAAFKKHVPDKLGIGFYVFNTGVAHCWGADDSGNTKYRDIELNDTQKKILYI